MSIRLALGISLLTLSLTTIARADGHFTGKLSFHPTDCEKTRDCFLDQDFGYVDSKGVGWQAEKNDETDGASIPDWAQPAIGLPFDPSFIQAAVIHDHYCNRHVRPMLQTHWVFYDGLLTSKVSSVKAKIMYAAILIGGPKWIDLIPGKPCAPGKMCIQSVAKLELPADAYVATADDAHSVVAREAQYDKPEVKAAIEDIRQRIEANPDAVTEADMLAEAQTVPQNQFFFEHIDGITVAPVAGGIKQ